METPLMIQALEALRKKDLTEARRLLRLHLDHSPDDAIAWYWLCQVADQPAEGIECLQQVLRIATAKLPTSPDSSDRDIEASLPAVPESPPTKRSAPRLHRAIRWVAHGLAVLAMCVVAAVVIPLLFGGRALVILSGSMVPAITTGSVVIVRPIPSDMLQVGEVIAFSPGPNAKLPRVHRIVRIRNEAGTRFYTTQGDANSAVDADEVSLPQTAWQVWYSVPLIGYVISFASSETGVWLLVVIPIIGLGVSALVDKLRTIPRNQLLGRSSNSGSVQAR